MSFTESFEDINNKIKNKKNNIFREYLINNDSFIATNKFFISHENDNGMIEFRIFNVNSINEKLTPYLSDTNIYISMKDPEKKSSYLNFYNYIDLVTISDITFSIDDIKIEKRTIIKKFIENDCEINDKLFEELYFNTDFSKKINIELPKKYNNKKIFLENIDIEKKYLFKIDFIELNRNFYQENNIINQYIKNQ